MSEEKKVLLRISHLKQYFPIGKKQLGKPQAFVKANDGISLNIYEGETFGLVGESGCGKSTFGRTLLQLYKQTGGRTVYYGRTVEDFDLKYVEDIFKNLPDEKKKCEEMRGKIQKLYTEYEGISDKIQKKVKGQEIAELESEFLNKLLDITALIGGIYTASDLTEAGKHYLAEYQAAKEIRGIRAQIKEIKKNEKGLEKIPELEAKIPALEETVKKELVEIDKIRQANKSNPDFEKYEGQKDDGINLAALTDKEMRYLRRDLQLIFQDPYSSLSPRLPVGEIIGEAVREHNLVPKSEYADYVTKIMDDCGLQSYHKDRYPHEFSGGQRQRICIARALALNPEFVVCDEPVSALDVSVQAQIINLLKELQEKRNLTYLFISHDLSVVEHISDTIGVMYLGGLVETGTTADIFANPLHPYTEALFSAIPMPDPDLKRNRIILEGNIPSPANPPKGCKFHTRCRKCMEICKTQVPEVKDMGNGHKVRCHLYD